MPKEESFESVESMYIEMNGQKCKKNSGFCPFLRSKSLQTERLRDSMWTCSFGFREKT